MPFKVQHSIVFKHVFACIVYLKYSTSNKSVHMFYPKNKVVSNHQLYNFSYKNFYYFKKAYVLFYFYSIFASNYLKPLQLGSLKGDLVYLIIIFRFIYIESNKPN